MFEAIFWDNDGVLVDTERLYYQATREVLAEVGVALSEETYVELFLRQALGVRALADQGLLPVAEVEPLRARRNRRYAELLAAGPTAIPGVADMVRRLAAHYRMAIVTSSEHFDHIHRDRAFLDLFEFVLTPADYTHCKPHPEPYLRARERMGLPPERCLVIEDSERGLRAARAAGLTCWVVPSDLTAGCAFEGADRRLGSLREIETLLLPAH